MPHFQNYTYSLPNVLFYNCVYIYTYKYTYTCIRIKILINFILFQVKMKMRKALFFLCVMLGTIHYGSGCHLSEYMCDTGYCVALDKFCNGNDDCGDKSDEPPYCSRKSYTVYISQQCLSKVVS